MRRLLCAVVAALAWTAPAHAAAAPVPTAQAYYVVNASNGEVLASHDAQVALPIASITKLMTVIVALQHLKLDDVVTVSRRGGAGGRRAHPAHCRSSESRCATC